MHKSGPLAGGAVRRAAALDWRPRRFPGSRRRQFLGNLSEPLPGRRSSWRTAGRLDQWRAGGAGGLRQLGGAWNKLSEAKTRKQSAKPSHSKLEAVLAWPGLGWPGSWAGLGQMAAGAPAGRPQISWSTFMFCPESDRGGGRAE